jgi:hypothetical protein
LLDALGDRDAHVGDGDAGVGEAEFGVVDQVAGMLAPGGSGRADPEYGTSGAVGG